MNSRFDALGTYCVPLEIAVEAGIVALIVFAAFFVSLLGRAHLAFYSKTIGWERWLCAGMAAALFGIAAMGMVDTVLPPAGAFHLLASCRLPGRRFSPGAHQRQPVNFIGWFRS
jgi:hypothetical protein